MIYLVIGRRERGKTTLAYHMASKVPARLIFDPRRMIMRPSPRARNVPTSTTLTHAVDDVLDGSLDEMVYGPTEDRIENAFARFARECKRWVLEAPDSPVAIVIDEASFADLTLPTWHWVMRCSRREHTHIFLTAHRPVEPEIPVSVRSIADHWLLFACRQEHDLKVIEKRCSPAVAQTVQTLQSREFVHWDDERAIAKTQKQSGAWYVALRPAPTREIVAAPTYDGDAVEERPSWQMSRLFPDQ